MYFSNKHNNTVRSWRILRPGLLKKSFLILSDSEKLYILETDASDYAMGDILEQKINGKFHPVVFYSRKFTDAELNYKIHDKKLLIIIAIFKKNGKLRLCVDYRQLNNIIIKNHLFIKLDKCQFYIRIIGFLGFVISPNGIKIK